MSERGPQKPHLKYLVYVLKHKWFVLRAGLKTGVPIWRLLIHDYTKFSRAEWTPYVNRFFAGRAGLEDKTADPDEFKLAWKNHYEHNPHHWNYWVNDSVQYGVRTAGCPPYPREMPDGLVREMVADWMGAGRAITGKWETAEWYAKTRDSMKLHPNTRFLAETLLTTYCGWTGVTRTPGQASDAAGMIRVDLTPAQANALILSVGRDTSSRYVDDLYSPLLLAERALRRALGHYASADDRRHRVTPGTSKCRCDTDGRRCEFPCWQRLAVTDTPCCPDCAPLPAVEAAFAREFGDSDE